jgi:hypothetical protein
MEIHRAKGAIAIAIVILASTLTLTLTVAVPASAAVAASSKGANPHSAFCKLEKAALAANSPSSAKEVAVSKALESGNWKAAQKSLLALEGQTDKQEQEITSDLASAPAKVKAAVQEVIKLIPLELKAIKNSTSVHQFDTALQAATSGAKFVHAETVFQAYDTAQCGAY